MKFRFIHFTFIFLFISFLALEHAAHISVVEISTPDVTELVEENVAEINSVDNLLILTNIFTHFDVTLLSKNHHIIDDYYTFTLNNTLFRPPRIF